MTTATKTDDQPVYTTVHAHLNGHDYYAILIPTAPFPFGGAILYVPVEWVEPADMEFDGLLNIYMSMGATSTDYLHKEQIAERRDK